MGGVCEAVREGRGGRERKEGMREGNKRRKRGRETLASFIKILASFSYLYARIL